MRAQRDLPPFQHPGDSRKTLAENGMRISDYMNINPVRINDGSSVRQAVEIVTMTNAADLMVVGENDVFIGTLSEGDLVRKTLPDLKDLAKEMEESERLPPVFRMMAEKGEDLARQTIDDLVIREPLTLRPSQHVHRAGVIMAKYNIRNLPVVENNTLIGSFARADLCRAVIR
jgi:predicted transcriptional regulator